MGQQPTVFFVLPSADSGGAARVFLTLANGMAHGRFRTTIVFLTEEGPCGQGLPNNVMVFNCGKRKARQAILRLAQLVRRQRPDFLLSTLGYINLLVLLVRPLMPKTTYLVARESNIPSMNLLQSPYPKLFSSLYRRLYPKFDLIICQSEDMKNDLVKNFHIPAAKVRIINNPVDTASIARLARKPGQYFPQERINLLAAGKLMHQKGFDLLLQAFAQLDLGRFHLTILGKGPEELPLKRHAQDLGIARSVTFAGFQQNPYPYMAQADLFVLSSRFEGFPNVVLEAHACGTPVVAFACPGGLTEIIRAGEDGLLVQPEDPLDLAHKISEAVEIPWDKNKIVSSVSERYGLEKIVHQYEKAFDSLPRRTLRA